MVGWAYDVVCGMEYMHHIASPFAIHGDLAARYNFKKIKKIFIFSKRNL